MSDLSGLNPTPHAIAVYASQPLSPVATQHSLPSRRYPLLGPDFHRLDRTSLRLAHLFDHLVGAVEQNLWDGETALMTSSPIEAAFYRLFANLCVPLHHSKKARTQRFGSVRAARAMSWRVRPSWASSEGDLRASAS